MSYITRTEKFDTFETSMSAAYRIHRQLMEQFMIKSEAGELDEYEESSYLARALERQKNSELSLHEVHDLIFAGLLINIEITSSALNWGLVHLALNPDVQQKLFEECRGGEYSTIAELEYLNAFIREVHRVTPVVSAPCIKQSN